eukprot:399822_1
MVAIVVIAAAAGTATVAIASIRNISETFSILHTDPSSSSSSSILSQYVSSSNTLAIPNKSSKEIISDLEQLKRKELMELFLLCDAPTDEDMKSNAKAKAKDSCDSRYGGEWDGILMDNNEIMTPIASFITNSVFGIRHGGKWAGKQLNFSSLSSSSKDDNGSNNSNSNSNSNSNIGINRFYSTQDNVDIDIDIELEHSFAISIAPSSLRRRRNDNDDGNSKSIMLNYSPYQGILSPWKTMVDELRVLKPPSLNTSKSKSRKDDRGILLCVGSMAWTGGYWNGTPFLLVQRD